LKIKINRLQSFAHIGSLIPLVVLVIDVFNNNLTVNLIQ